MGATIVRTHGLLNVFSDQVGATEHPFGAAAILVADGEQFDAGVVAMPTPYTESDDADFFFHTYWATSLFFTANGVSSVPFRKEVESKAMRKLKENDVVVWLIQNQSNVDGTLFSWATRIYVKLP